MLKYLPKSKLGAVLAVLYILFVGLLLLVIGTNDTGGHTNPIILIIVLAFIVTFPLSWMGAWILDVASIESNTTAEFAALFVILAFSALFNAAVIYLAFGFLSRAVRTLFRRSK